MTSRPPYPGRPELDAANMRFRRALSRLHREATRHDPELLPQLAAIVGEATEHLLRLASDADAVENTSIRHRKALADAEAELQRQIRRLARSGAPADLVQRLAARAERRAAEDAQPKA